MALLESLIASGGLNGKNLARAMLPWESLKWQREVGNMRRIALADPELAGKWAKHGMQLSFFDRNLSQNPNFQNNEFMKDLKAIEDWNVPILKQGVRWGGAAHKWVNDWLWMNFFPSIKLYAAEQMLTELTENFEARGVSKSRDEIMDTVAKTMNDAFGGQNWDQYLWATPEMRQLLHLMWFAPDWTLSAINISGMGNLPGLKQLIGENQSDMQKEWELKRYWPAMSVIVMTAIPQAVQMAVLAAARSLPGPDDEDDKYFLFQNEIGKSGIAGSGIGGHIDMTPLLRKLGWIPLIGYEGGDTGKRRVYLRWAKQASEIFEGWAGHPLRTFKSKQSSAVRAAYEQITGTNSATWELGFKDKSLLGGLFEGKKGLRDGRLTYLARHFAPMSLLTILDGRPTTFFAPASRGKSLYGASKELQEVMMH